jgi:hypothetical protein
MRGGDVRSEALFSYLSGEARVPADHPLRPIRKIADESLGALSPEFEKLYAKLGRPPACAGAGLIAPEKLLRALLLQAFYSVRSERQLIEQLDDNLPFRWFVGHAVSVRERKRIEEVFGWTKAAAGFRKTHRRGLARVGWMLTLTTAAYNLVRRPKLVGVA